MLSYLHGFHAGNAADVHKHALFVAALDRLQTKAKPISVIDLYAGRAIYDLRGTEAQKNREFDHGVARTKDSVSDALAPYLDLVRKTNAGDALSLYPGSPELARRRLRPGDALIVNELHPTESKALRAWAQDDPAIHVHARDAIEALTGLLPPRIRRGIALIDPPYEVKTEYDTIARALPGGVARWPEGIFMVWFPILDDGRHRHLVDGLSAMPGIETLLSTIHFARHRDGHGLLGSGVLIIRPPWQFHEQTQAIERALASVLKPASGQNPTLESHS